MEWWSERDSNPHLPLARRGLCRLSYRPMEMVPGVGFEPTSPRFRRGAVTRSAFQAEFSRLARTAGIEPTPPEWRSGTLPLSHVRKLAEGEGIEPSTARSARFSGPVACQTRH